MRHEDDLRPEQSSGPHVFDDVIVIADEYAALPPVDLKYNVLAARFHVPVDERVNLAELGLESVFVDADVGFVQVIINRLFKKPRKDYDIVPSGNFHQVSGSMPLPRVLQPLRFLKSMMAVNVREPNSPSTLSPAPARFSNI